MGVVNWQQMLHAFQFEDHFILNDEIQTLAAIKLDAFIFNGQGDLALKRESAKAEFAA